MEAFPDGFRQNLMLEWLHEAFNGARLHGFDRSGHITVARNKHDRHVSPIAGKALLEVETIEVRKRYVKHQAAWDEGPRFFEEFLSGCERFWLPAFAADQ